jgi:hypothetical protein
LAHHVGFTLDFGGGNQSSNGGLLLLRRAERNIGICRRLADAEMNIAGRRNRPAVEAAEAL